MIDRIGRRHAARLRTVPLFARLNDRELQTIDRLVDEIEVAQGEVLIDQGATGAQQSFVIVSGTASVEVDGSAVATLGPGELFGEMAMLDNKPRSATVVALTPMKLLVIGPAQFQTFISQPGMALAVLKSVVGRLREAEGGSDPQREVDEAGAA